MYEALTISQLRLASFAPGNPASRAWVIPAGSLAMPGEQSVFGLSYQRLRLINNPF